jgi:UDP-GlcNAc:undecaprenyl-phosphate GlcNAc-1-phosphate transferase
MCRDHRGRRWHGLIVTIGFVATGQAQASMLVGGRRTRPRVADSMKGLPSFGLTLAIALLLGPLVLWGLRRRRLFDVPNERSSHAAPVARGGGLAPALALVCGAVLSMHLVGDARVGVLIGAVGMALIGLTDDVRGLQVLTRLLGQVVVAAGALVFLEADISGSLAWVAVFSVGALVWVVSYVNAFNFMDGINGISVAQVVVAGGAWWLIGRTQGVPTLETGGLLVAAAGLGFAPFNVGRARMFLGDVGSYLFGGWLAAMVVVGLRAHLPPEALLGPLVLYGADTATTLLRRLRRHEVVLRAHREHAYQRLVQAGWSHVQTSLFCAAVMAACSGLAALSLSGSLAARIAGDTGALALLVAYLGTPALVVRRSASVHVAS